MGKRGPKGRPKLPREPMRVSTVNLAERQWAYLRALAAEWAEARGSQYDVSAVLRMLLDFFIEDEEQGKPARFGPAPTKTIAVPEDLNAADLRAAREALGLTQRQLAERLKIGP